MMISTRGRYALRVACDLAVHNDGGFIPMRDIAERQCLSLGYVARIIPVLSKAGIVEGTSGKGGGYRLKRAAKDCTVAEILNLTEECLTSVKCLEKGVEPCERRDCCLTLPVWQGLQKVVDDYLSSITIDDVIKKNVLNKVGL